MKNILYLTDKLGVSVGYRPMFDQLLALAGIKKPHVTVSHIYRLVPNAIKRNGNAKAMIMDPDYLGEIHDAVETKVAMTKPDLIVTSCPAVLGLITHKESAKLTVDATRGSVYDYHGVPVIITLPIAASNRQVTNKGEDESYAIKSGAWILTQDWRKIGRFYNGADRKLPAFRYSVCRTRADLDAAERFLEDCFIISSDIETSGGGEGSKARHFITCVGYTGIHKSGRVHSFVIPFWDRFKPQGMFWDSDEDFFYAWETMRRVNANPVYKTFANGTYDNSYNIKYGVPANNYLLDCQHMWHSMYPELKKSLNFIASILLDNYFYWKDDIKGIKDDGKGNTKDSNMEGYWRYNAYDCYFTLFCTLFLLVPMLGDKKMSFNFQHEFMLALSGLQMSMRGIKADKKRLQEIEDKLIMERAENLKRFQFITDEPGLNPESSVQMKSLFYDVLGATPRDDGGKIITSRSRKKPSTGEKALRFVKTEHPLFGLFVDAMWDTKQPQKQISGICAMGRNLQTDRFRYKLSASATETWRYSAKASDFWDGTNAQNITKDMRDWLVANDDWVLIDIDYSQSDFYFVAYESQDMNMINLTLSGKDTHSYHAAHFFKMAYEDVVNGKNNKDALIVDPKTGIRNLSKRVVHGSNFRMASGTLYITMGHEETIAAAKALGFDQAGGWDAKQLTQICARLMGGYRGLYPRLSDKEWYGEINRELETGFITNWFGMTRRFMGDPKDHTAQREATAFYGQSGTAFNMNRVQYELDYGYIPKNFRDGPNPSAGRTPITLHGMAGRTHMLLQVHDSFILAADTRNPAWQENVNKVLTVMERPLTIHGREFFVPAEAEVSLRWNHKAIPWDRNNPPSYDKICELTG